MAKKFHSFMKTVGGNEGDKCNYPTRLDTYGCGCGHDCAYCYAKSLLSFRGLWKPEKPSVADFKKLLAAIPKLEGVTRLGGMTDCFQPCEETHKVTYLALQALKAWKKPYLIVTKSALVADDKYMELYQPELAHFQVTVTSTDEAIAGKYEKASAPEDRIAAIEKLADAGFDVSLRLSPFIPEWIDKDRINAVRCERMVAEFLRVNHWIEKWLEDVDLSAYKFLYHGYRHMSLDAKRKHLEGFNKEITVCEDADEHAEYWNEQFNPNPEDCCNLKFEGS